MPRSDTWPGGIGLETMTGMDSAGSCDSVVSANSGFSDDSLDYLSAEEKACLMFLEETIESLDTEDDSGLSNDEPDQLPYPGKLANTLADLSASMSKSKLNGSQAQDESIKEKFATKPMQSYLVPTPIVMARSSVFSAKPGVLPDKNLCSKSQLTPSSNKSGHQHIQKPPQVPLEVNVEISPPTKPRDYSVRMAEAPLPRGPLSYEALVHLRRSASTKKTPLCPSVDHTIDSDKRSPVTVEDPNLGDLSRSDRSHSEASKSKMGPPVVAPKPKRIPSNISVMTQNKSSINSSDSVKHATDSKVVKQEALQKLGLLKDQQPKNEAMDQTPNRFVQGPAKMNASRSPSFCYSQMTTEPKNKPVQSSASFHHFSRHGQQSASVSYPVQPNGSKAAGVERSSTLDNPRKGGYCPEPQHITAAEPVKSTTKAQNVPQKPSNSVGYTVMVVPGMGADRKEALRKLGLLKD
ncbi:hypothetical protein PAMP_017028 [Pampus punctatissimus]